MRLENWSSDQSVCCSHERWMIVSYIMGGVRGVLEECFKWAAQRKVCASCASDGRLNSITQVFGKPLVQQPLIRWKLARMISEIEAHQNWLEHLTHQMCEMSYEEAAFELAG